MLRSTCPVCGFKLTQPADRCPKCPTDFASWQRGQCVDRYQFEDREEKGGAGFVIGLALVGLLVVGAVIWKKRASRPGPLPAAGSPGPGRGQTERSILVPTLVPDATTTEPSMTAAERRAFLERHAQQPANVPAPGGATSPGATLSEFVARDNNGNDEAYWKGRVAEWRRRVEEQQQKADEAGFVVNSARQAASASDASQVAALAAQYQIEAAKLKAIQDLWPELVEQCRKAGCQPGWLR